MCFTEKRILKPGLELITRRCKQEQACIQQQNQNPMPSMARAQCHKFQGSVCRCCCNHDNCNNNVTTSCVIGGKPHDDDDHNPLDGYDLVCSTEEIIAHGTAECKEDPDKFRVTCKYTCDDGYILQGKSESLCLATPYPNDHMKPYCAHESLVYYNHTGNNHGNHTGNHGNETGNHHGNETGNSTDNTDHNIMKRDVLDRYCQEPKSPSNGSKLCQSLSFIEGTSCLFTCDEGYHLYGESILSCVENSQNNVDWNNPVPECVLY